MTQLHQVANKILSLLCRIIVIVVHLYKNEPVAIRLILDETPIKDCFKMYCDSPFRKYALFDLLVYTQLNNFLTFLNNLFC